MIMNVGFEDVETTVMSSTKFDVIFTDINSVFDVDFGEVHEVGDPIGGLEVYDGEYSFTPIAETNQVIPTAEKYVEKDIVIEPIPYAAVSNLSDGLTVTIG